MSLCYIISSSSSRTSVSQVDLLASRPVSHPGPSPPPHPAPHPPEDSHSPQLLTQPACPKGSCLSQEGDSDLCGGPILSLTGPAGLPCSGPAVCGPDRSCSLLCASPHIFPSCSSFFLGSRRPLAWRGGKLGMGGHGGRRGRGSSGGSAGHGGLLELGVIREMWAGSGDH